MARFEASVHPDDWGPVREALERSARSGEPIDVEYRIVHARRRPRAVDLLRGRVPREARGEAGPPDGRLHRHHRSQGRRGGASRQRGSPAGGHRPRRSRVLRGGLRRAHALRRRTARDILGLPPELDRGPPARRVLPGATCTPRTASASSTLAEQLARPGGWSRLAIEYRFIHPDARGEVAAPRGPRRPARRARTHAPVVWRHPRHHGARSNARRRCGSRWRRSSG